MSFDFSNVSGESFGDINEIFFKKDGKSILPPPTNENSGKRVSADEIAKEMAEMVDSAKKNKNQNPGSTIIQISKEVLGEEEDRFINLTGLEEKRKTYSTIRNKHFIDVNDGSEIQIVEKTEMFNGISLFTVKHFSNGKLVTYPRSKFVGRTKQFVPKEFYVREAERAIEDTIERNGEFIFELISDSNNLFETADGRFLELLLDEHLDILGGIPVPNKIQIPVKRMFDLEYKILMLENVICLDNKIAGLLFVDIWF